ncbi:hypothetical protein ACEPAI_2339 [Sanghuangporus weigelae]
MKMTPQFDFQNVPMKELAEQNLGYSAVVLYLVNFWRLRELLLSMSYLFNNVKMHPWPILLMYSDDLDDQSRRNEFMLRLYDFLGGNQEARWFIGRIEWIRLEWHLPDNMSHDKSVVDPVFADYWPGYHQMCAFFASQIFDHPRLKDVTYYMRLDTDSYIFKPLCYDPVDLFHQHNRSYAFNVRTTDPDWVTVGLWNLVDEYAHLHSEVEENLQSNGWQWPANRNPEEMGKHDFPTYYNNFEIVKLDAFRRPDVRAWLDEIMRVPERIYKYRWGDAPIRFATVSMFFDVEKDVEEYCGMDYWHNGVHGNHCSCKSQLRPQSQHFTELKQHQKYVVQSSDVIEDLRVFVKEEGSERIYWYKERFLTDDEIVENVVENASSRICWTIHRPKRGWYIKIRSPFFPPGVSIPLTPLSTSSPFYTDAALSFSTRINPPKRIKHLNPPIPSSSRVSSPPTHSSKSSTDTVSSSSETVVHSYPPTPSPRASNALGQPPSPDSVRAKLDQISNTSDQRPAVSPEVRQFFLAPHSIPHVPESQNASLITKALSIFRNHQPSHSLSFTLCPLPPSEDASSSSSASTSHEHASSNAHSKRHSLSRIGELIPPSPPALITFHDRSPAWSLGSFSGLLEIDIAMERELGVDRSFWVTVALTYMEFLLERESYLAAAGG